MKGLPQGAGTPVRGRPANFPRVFKTISPRELETQEEGIAKGINKVAGDQKKKGDYRMKRREMKPVTSVNHLLRAYTERLRPKGISFSGSKYMKG